jgi:hypothetical protein
MNVRILAASAFALIILAPVAGVAAVHRSNPAATRNEKTDDSEKCVGGIESLGTMECKMPSASFKAKKEPSIVKTSSAEIALGTGGSGNPIWVPKVHKLVLVTKANPVLSFTDVGITGRS